MALGSAPACSSSPASSCSSSSSPRPSTCCSASYPSSLPPPEPPRRSSSSAVAPPPPPAALLLLRLLRPCGGGMEDGEKDLIESLPLFTLSSALATLPKSSPDCAVCLSRFHPHDQLRLLPSCRHAFHSTCIDTWLRSSLSCPLCRSSILQEVPSPLPFPPPPPPPAPPLAPAAVLAGDATSGSFRVEIGCVSRRRTPEDPTAGPPHSRSYSLGSSFHYVVEEEVDAVVASVAASLREQRRKEHSKDLHATGPAPPGENVAEAAGGGGSRGWLMDYVERLASSASSSFSSLRFAGCGSRRIDGGAIAPGGAASWWDLEGGRRPPPAVQQNEEHDDDAGSFHSFFRWLVGVSS
ncbi:unnamed protein product [Spirodela intermedia]|uniref:RING-type domain-containing protein n=1 Tax=Spirodela intermedia TaxID=51605 RepID=A0A7I8JA75_SPIIN|nr:unnamed protein product [Spirodela intermedia]CAA6667000.1 unnamed protein product [Spirodela intermedia]